MDFSGSSLDLTAAVKNPCCEVTDFASQSTEVDKFPPVGPLSSIGVDNLQPGEQSTIFSMTPSSGFWVL